MSPYYLVVDCTYPMEVRIKRLRTLLANIFRLVSVESVKFELKDLTKKPIVIPLPSIKLLQLKSDLVG